MKLQNPSLKGVDQGHHMEFMGTLAAYFIPIDKANIIAGCLENQFRMFDMCD